MRKKSRHSIIGSFVYISSFKNKAYKNGWKKNHKM